MKKEESLEELYICSSSSEREDDRKEEKIIFSGEIEIAGSSSPWREEHLARILNPRASQAADLSLVYNRARIYATTNRFRAAEIIFESQCAGPYAAQRESSPRPRTALSCPVCAAIGAAASLIHLFMLVFMGRQRRGCTLVVVVVVDVLSYLALLLPCPYTANRR